ncbi:MAG TPA: c-type cytochrome [Chromatiaceae bacterium]|nr:c-type cytochrome [Chromatiaceae bacterium]
MTPPLTRSLLLAAVTALIPFATQAADKAEEAAAAAADAEAGRLAYRQCALCHGQWGQGILGGKYPRIAGLPEYYLLKVLDDYRGGERNYEAMTVVGGVRNMSDEDLANMSAYIAGIDLDEKAPLDVPTPAAGDVEAGGDIYGEECKTCHGKAGQGNVKKKSPAIRGQYPEYLARQIDLFNGKKREHAGDPDDETFKDFTPEQIQDILAYLTTLDDK